MLDVLSLTAIEQVLRRYCRGIDRLDEACLKTVWAVGATVDYGEGQIDAGEWSSNVLQRLRAWDRTMHLTANTIADIAGEFAQAETYVLAYHQVGGLAPRWMLAAGRYLDEFVLASGTWRIAKRTFILDWNESGASTCTLGSGAFARFSNIGARHPEDLLYR